MLRFITWLWDEFAIKSLLCYSLNSTIGDLNVKRERPSNFSFTLETVHTGQWHTPLPPPHQPKCHVKLGHLLLTWFLHKLSPKVRICLMTKLDVRKGKDHKSQCSVCFQRTQGPSLAGLSPLFPGQRASPPRYQGVTVGHMEEIGHFQAHRRWSGGSAGKESTCNAGHLGWENPLEKEMATHSSTLAWKIPWTEEPGRLQSMGSQRVGHDWVTSFSVEKWLLPFTYSSHL